MTFPLSCLSFLPCFPFCVTFFLTSCFRLDVWGSYGHLSRSFIVKTYFGIFSSCFSVMLCIFNDICFFIFSVEFNLFMLQTRPLLTAGSKDSVPHPLHSAQEVPPLPENRPNLLAVQPHFGNIIALSEVTRPEDRYNWSLFFTCMWDLTHCISSYIITHHGHIM
jgi:hypothetical protein